MNKNTVSYYNTLANRIVALGVGTDWKDGTYTFSQNPEFPGMSSAEIFVNDWRVAGALMEKVCDNGWWPELEKDQGKYSCLITGPKCDSEDSPWAKDKSFPLAISLACADALEHV